MNLIILWAGIASASLGLIANNSGGNGSAGFVIGTILILVSMFLFSHKNKNQQTQEISNQPEEISEISAAQHVIHIDEDEDEEILKPAVPAVPEIKTRTTPSKPGHKYFDRYAGRERPFSEEEDSHLLELYQQGLNLISIANRMVIDQRQVAIRLIRLLLDPKDAIEDEESAENNRRSYKKGEKDEIEAEYRLGHSIDSIAHSHGRTVLAIGWQLLERPSRPVEISRR